MFIFITSWHEISFMNMVVVITFLFFPQTNCLVKNEFIKSKIPILFHIISFMKFVC